MQAHLTNFRQAPRKVRLVASLIRGKSIEAAENQLANLPKKSSLSMRKLLASAVANAVNNQKADRNLLYIKEIRVDKGLVLKRFLPGSHGRAYPLRRASSHINIKLEIKDQKSKIKGNQETVSTKVEPSLGRKVAKKKDPKKTKTL
ncbi:MAG: 50S ribosomal protein L22 [Candidatus Vogelbacteria bacterium CG22_combo_CG10-13_8_21_14_all_37_9]|uniref:Large ribosomal subunit protein uL22 n=1 Tax=Candidatus Vogelbacteria bacterium CG22_combo_CG10-13_8_21_14_all_37_9 TaxID=1975046 RepID=A0A2H0BKU5_9BACT|nr:MAG: 50S ribosomal protein L22 [Candidatus Vogelbacteria bacterium CG22_combo_CG10-13_8_21_14_all_37_9]